MSRDHDDEENLLTAQMRAAFVVRALRPDFAERVTRAWLTERTRSAPRRRWPALPHVLATLTFAVCAMVLLWLRAAPKPSATERHPSVRVETPTTETKRRANNLRVGDAAMHSQEPESDSRPSLPAAAPHGSQLYRPVSAEKIKQLPNIDSDACGRSIHYPSEAMRLGIQGDVILRVELDAAGGVYGIRVLSGLGHGLDEAAIFALTHKCKFTPAIDAGGIPVAFVIPRYVFHFETPNSSTQMQSTPGLAKAPPGQGRSCSAKNKCAVGLQCLTKDGKSTCEIMCEANSDCPEDQRCVADSYGEVCRPISDLNL